MKKKLTFMLFVAVTSVLSAQQNAEIFYKEIDEDIAKKNYSSFKIDIPENWFSYFTDPGIIAHSPNEFKGKVKPNVTSVSFIVVKKNYKRKNLERSLNSFLSFQKQFYKEFKYELFEAKHKLYGTYYIVKYIKKTNFDKEVVLVSIMSWKKQIYHLYYISEESTFNKYLIAATEMINSFEIKE